MSETDKIKMWECFLEPDGTPMKISSALVTVDGEIIEQAEGSGKNGIYIWDIPAELLSNAKIHLKCPEIGLDKQVIYSPQGTIDEAFRMSDAEEVAE